MSLMSLLSTKMHKYATVDNNLIIVKITGCFPDSKGLWKLELIVNNQTADTKQVFIGEHQLIGIINGGYSDSRIVIVRILTYVFKNVNLELSIKDQSYDLKDEI